MKKSLTLLGATLCLAVAAFVFVPDIAQAAPVDVLSGCRGDSSVCQNSGGGNAVYKIIKGIINLLITIAGIISVIMIIVGGIKYSTSGGDAKAISSGKDTLVYAVIGLVISVMAFAIVNVVLGKIG